MHGGHYVEMLGDAAFTPWALRQGRQSSAWGRELGVGEAGQEGYGGHAAV